MNARYTETNSSYKHSSQSNLSGSGDTRIYGTVPWTNRSARQTSALAAFLVATSTT